MDTNFAGVLTLDFPAPRTVSNTFLWFINYTDLGILLQQPEQTKTYTKKAIIYKYIIVFISLTDKNLNFHKLK